MSWDIEIPIIVRTLVNDLEVQPLYSDERLKQIICVAGRYVQIIKDDIFSGLLALKAACIIDHSTLRTKAATEGIRAALGPAMLNVNGSLEGIKLIMEAGPCATYDELVSHWNVS